MNASQRLPTAETDDSDRAGWSWLLELRQRFAPVVEVTDEQLVPLLPLQEGELSARFRELLGRRDDPELEAVVRAASESHAIEVAGVGNLRIAVVVVDIGGGRRIFLILAEPVDERASDERSLQLRRIAAWLARNVGALAADAEPALQDWRELSILHRLLSQAVAHGSEQDVIRSFVEAIAVWNDVDARAYIADFTGASRLEVTLAGAEASRAPRILSADVLQGASIARLDRAEAGRLGFSGQDDVLLMRIEGPRSARWTIAYLGAIDPHDEVRFAVYADVLRSSLQAAAEIESSRLMWAMMQRLVGETGAVEEAVTAAATELSQATVASVDLRLVRSDGVILLAVGTNGHAFEGTPSVAGERMTFPLAVPHNFSAHLVLRRPPACPFTPREQRLGDVGASILGPWLSAVLQGGRLAADRRAGARNLDQLIEDKAGRASTEGVDVSVVVFRPPEESPVELRHALVGEIRRRLRPFDVAGTLTSGEIGILLQNASLEGAKTVVNRIRRALEEDATLAVLSGAPIGIASSRSSEIASFSSYVHQARERASHNGD